MLTIEKHLCKTCENLSYWDGYFCKIGRHQTNKEKLNMRPLNECCGYIKRQGTNRNSCKNQECIFWCAECPAYEKD